MKNLEKVLEKDVPRLKKTMAKREDEHLIPDYDRLRLSQMLIGLITEYEEVMHCMNKIDYFMKYRHNSKDLIAKATAEKLRKELLLEIGDMYWYIINSFEFLSLNSPLAAIETALGIVTEIDPIQYEQLRINILDKTKKYLFQMHDLHRYEKDFFYFIAASIRVTKLILNNTYEVFKKVDFEEEYKIADVIAMVADKLEKRYEGEEFSAEKSMNRGE